MSQNSPQSASATQALRELIDDLRYGQACPDDLDNELLQLEAALGLPLTIPAELAVAQAAEDAAEAVSE